MRYPLRHSAVGTFLFDTPRKLPSGTITAFSYTDNEMSKSVSVQTNLEDGSWLPGQTQCNLIFTGACSAQIVRFGHTTPISISVRGTVPPSGSVTVPLMNLGKTITLPGSSESLNPGIPGTG